MEKPNSVPKYEFVAVRDELTHMQNLLKILETDEEMKKTTREAMVRTSSIIHPSFGPEPLTKFLKKNRESLQSINKALSDYFSKSGSNSQPSPDKEHQQKMNSNNKDQFSSRNVDSTSSRGEETQYQGEETDEGRYSYEETYSDREVESQRTDNFLQSTPGQSHPERINTKSDDARSCIQTTRRKDLDSLEGSFKKLIADGEKTSSKASSAKETVYGSGNTRNDPFVGVHSSKMPMFSKGSDVHATRIDLTDEYFGRGGSGVSSKGEGFVTAEEVSNTDSKRFVTGKRASNTDSEGFVTAEETSNTDSEGLVTAEETSNTDSEELVTAEETSNTDSEGLVTAEETSNTDSEGLVTAEETSNTDCEELVTAEEASITEGDPDSGTMQQGKRLVESSERSDADQQGSRKQGQEREMNKDPLGRDTGVERKGIPDEEHELIEQVMILFDREESRQGPSKENTDSERDKNISIRGDRSSKSEIHHFNALKRLPEDGNGSSTSESGASGGERGTPGTENELLKKDEETQRGNEGMLLGNKNRHISEMERLQKERGMEVEGMNTVYSQDAGKRGIIWRHVENLSYEQLRKQYVNILQHNSMLHDSIHGYSEDVWRLRQQRQHMHIQWVELAEAYKQQVMELCMLMGKYKKAYYDVKDKYFAFKAECLSKLQQLQERERKLQEEIHRIQEMNLDNIQSFCRGGCED